MNSDIEAIARLLNEHQVQFVLVGGVAMVLHGSSHVTEDVDVAISRDRENLARLVEREMVARGEEFPKHLAEKIDKLDASFFAATLPARLEDDPKYPWDNRIPKEPGPELLADLRSRVLCEASTPVINDQRTTNEPTPNPRRRPRATCSSAAPW